MCYNKVLLEYGISKLPSEILYKNKITIRLITINYAFKLKKFLTKTTEISQHPSCGGTLGFIKKLQYKNGTNVN